MPTLTVTKTYSDGNVLNEVDLDNMKNSLETFFNVTKIDSDNIQDLGIETDKLAASAVTTGKIAANAVTRAKMEAVGQQISSSSGVFATSSTSFVDVTNLSVSITVTGRPVRVEL